MLTLSTLSFPEQKPQSKLSYTPIVQADYPNHKKLYRITIHSFGLGMTHKPDTMIELSTRTKASYTYVKDWMMLRECLAGCLGSMQTLSHQNVKLKLKLPEGSPAKFHKISGALQITKRATGRDAEASLGDLRFGDKRDILVQLVILPDTSSQEQLPPILGIISSQGWRHWAVQWIAILRGLSRWKKFHLSKLISLGATS